MAEAGQIKTVDKFVFLGYILESKFTNVSI